MRLELRRVFYLFIGCCLITFGVFLSPVHAIQWTERPPLTWEKAALKLFDRGDYDRVIDEAKDEDKDPNSNAPLFIYYCHAQKYYLEENKTSAIYYETRYKSMLNRLRGNNLAVLTRLTSMPQLSWNKKVNRKFLNAAFKNVGEEYLGAILYYLNNPDQEVSNASIKGLQTILQRKRNIVMNGGSLSKADRKWMSDKRLLKILVRKTGGGLIPLSKIVSKLPAFARKKAATGPSACLVLIEEPALPLLREAAGMGNANAAGTIQLIQDAMGARLARYPNSKWYSATAD